MSWSWFVGLLGGEEGGGVKGQKMVQNDKKLCTLHSISQEPYIMIFSILKIWFSGFSGDWRGKKWPKMTKISVCRTFYFSNHISYVSYDLHLWSTCMLKRIKWQKNSLSHSICQEPYIISLWFLVHMSKIMMSPAIFFIFQNFDFWGF